MTQALLHWDRSHTPSNGLNEVTKYTEPSTLNINQGLRAALVCGCIGTHST